MDFLLDASSMVVPVDVASEDVDFWSVDFPPMENQNLSAILDIRLLSSPNDCFHVELSVFSLSQTSFIVSSFHASA